MNAPPEQLQTKYVFVDTEAFRRAQFDWHGKALSKLGQFAGEGHLRLLITEVTKTEVLSQLQGWLNEVDHALKKHDVILGQLGYRDVFAALRGPDAFGRLEKEFEAFLTGVRAITVPTTATIEQIVADYFARKPPFSEKKKAEFPDAVVVSSLKAWCAKEHTKAYLVSGDQDMKDCCTSEGPLLHLATIEQIISQATVSKALHEALEEAISNSELLREWLAEKLHGLPVVRGDMRLRRFSGLVQRVYDVNIYNVNVLDRNDNVFTCELEVEAGMDVRLETESDGEDIYDFEEYGYAARRHIFTKSIHLVFTAQSEVTFNADKQAGLEVESVYVDKDEIDIDYKEMLGR